MKVKNFRGNPFSLSPVQVTKRFNWHPGGIRKTQKSSLSFLRECRLYVVNTRYLPGGKRIDHGWISLFVFDSSVYVNLFERRKKDFQYRVQFHLS